jgi:large subunit ribosomal protein L10
MATLSQKKVAAQQIEEALGEAKIVVLADYRGLSVAEVTQLRRQLRPLGARFLVAKNTLVKRVYGEALSGLAPYLKGPTALLLGMEDQVTPLKALQAFLKAGKKTNQVRAAYLDGSVLNEVDVDELGKLPSLDELRGKLVVCINYPLSSLVGALNSVPSALVRAMDQVGAQKQQAS